MNARLCNCDGTGSSNRVNGGEWFLHYVTSLSGLDHSITYLFIYKIFTPKYVCITF